MDRHKLNWRSFAGQNAINAQWNTPMTPAYYVIDHKGMICHKWMGNPGERAMETALERLIREAEGQGRTTPK